MAGCVKCGRWFWNRSGDFPPICSRCAGLRPAAGDASAARAVQRPTVTWALASACVFVFLLMTASGASVFDPSLEQVVAWGGDFGPATLGSDWWRLVTATFVHVGLLHLALNMWCLLTLGPIAERVFGRGLFFLLYLVSGVAGSATSLLVHPLIVGAGASGAIFGVAGALVAAGMRRDGSARPATLTKRAPGIATFSLYNLFYGFRESGIDNAAHLGGLVAGAALGMTLPFATGSRPRNLRAWLVAVSACVTVAVGFLVARQRDAPVAAFGAALIDIDAGRVGRGIERLRAVVALRPDLAPAQYALGSAYLHRGNPEEAIPPLRAAARLVPNDFDYQNNLGVALLRHGPADSAIAVFERAASLAPENALIYSNLGLAYESGARPRDAVGAFQKAVKFAPTTWKYRVFLGRAYLASQAFDTAIATFSVLLASEPRNGSALLGRGTAYRLLGQRGPARRDLETVVRLGATTAADSEIVMAAQRQLAELTAPARPSMAVRRIPSLNATVTSLRFYESGSNGLPHDQRVYGNTFPASTTRFIAWELSLKHPHPGVHRDFDISATWLRPDGSVWTQQTCPSHVEPLWTLSWHDCRWGWNEPGHYMPGTYQVELFVEGKSVAKGRFTITAP